MTAAEDRRTRMTRLLLDAPDPTTAVADLVADHEMRLDALVRRIHALESRVGEAER